MDVNQIALGGIVLLTSGYMLVTIALSVKAFFFPKKRDDDGVNSGAKFG